MLFFCRTKTKPPATLVDVLLFSAARRWRLRTADERRDVAAVAAKRPPGAGCCNFVTGGAVDRVEAARGQAVCLWDDETFFAAYVQKALTILAECAM